MRLVKATMVLVVIFLFNGHSLSAFREPIKTSNLIGPRTLAMAGSGVAIVGSSNACSLNPATLSFVSWPEITTGYGIQDLGDQMIWYLNGTYPLLTQLTGQIGFHTLNNPFVSDEQLSETKLAFAFPVTPNGQLRAGITGKFLQRYVETARTALSGGGVDLGLLYTIWESAEHQSLHLGVAMIDAQTVIKQADISYNLPTVFRYGLSAFFSDQWIANVEFDYQTTTEEIFEKLSVIRVGVEKTLKLENTEGVAIRAGFFHQIDYHTMLTVGAGLGYQEWRVDYALQWPSDFHDAFHQIGFSWSPGNTKQSSRVKPVNQPVQESKTDEPEKEGEDYSSMISILDQAADYDLDYQKYDTFSFKTEEKKEVTAEEDNKPEPVETAYNLPVPEGPAGSEKVTLGVQPEIPASFTGYFGATDSRYKLAEDDLRLHTVINPFSPNNDGKQDKTIFVGRLVNDRLDVRHWKLYILKGAEVVRQFKGGRRLPRNLEWDGRDENGTMKDDGTYQVVLKAMDENYLELASAMETVEIRTRSNPVEITGPDKVKLTGRASDKALSFTIPKVLGGSDWEFSIYDPEDRRIYRKSGVKDIPENISWNPRVNGNPPIQGNYRVFLKYRDSIGLKTRSETSFKINYAEFSTALSAQPALFKPAQAGGQSVTFSFQTKGRVKYSRWKLDIINQQTKAIVRTYRQTGSPPQELVWDGRDDNGKSVQGGRTYKGRLIVTTSLGTSASSESDAIQCDLGAYKGEKALSMNLVRILFDSGKSDLETKDKEQLDQAAETIKSYNMEYQLQITGHTDPQEEKSQATALSRKRAQKVADYLIEKGHIPSSKIQVVGHGSQQVISAPDNKSEQYKNRRVEVVLLAK